jgi:TRAP-type C4-dicarboxylate transport system permease small subunit
VLKWYDMLEEKVVGKILRTLCAFFLGALLMLFTMNIFNRLVPFTDMAWFEEIVTLCFAWMSFLGAAELWRQKSHFGVDFFLERVKKAEIKALASLFNDLICLIFFVIIIIFSIQWINGISATTQALAMPTGVLYISVPVGVIIMGIMSLRDLAEDAKSLFKK